MRYCFLILCGLTFLVSPIFGEPENDLWSQATSPSSVRAPGKVVQFLSEEDSSKAWVLTEDGLQYNGGLNSDGKWIQRFDKETFKKLTEMDPIERIKYRKIQMSKNKPGTLYLLVEANDPANNEKKNIIFMTADNGETWSTQAIKKGSIKESPAMKTGKKKGSGRDVAVDLNKMENEESSESKPAAPAQPSGKNFHGSLGHPLFKALFDLLLHVRPGVSPLTFDNYHTLLLVDFIPRPEVQLSFEVSSSPRYYEVMYKITPSWEVRGGRVWIPFDLINPHNSFGGVINTSKVRPPGTTPFLPDLWTDLGLATKVTLTESKDFTLDGHFYIVNGFQDGGNDPAGELGSRYPSFNTTPNVDNNGDKAMGLRAHADIAGGLLGVGASFYTGRWSGQADTSARTNIFGFDAQLRIAQTKSDLNAGYIYFKNSLLPGATASQFVRGGYYVQAGQNLVDKLKLIFRIGGSQNDSRIAGIDDITIIGGGLQYNVGMFQFSFQYFKDTNTFVGKKNYEYTALRAMAMF